MCIEHYRIDVNASVEYYYWRFTPIRFILSKQNMFVIIVTLNFYMIVQL